MRKLILSFIILLTAGSICVSQYIGNSYRFPTPAPSNQENFEETGTPSSGLWTAGGGDTSFDRTGHALVSEAMSNNDHNEHSYLTLGGSVTQFHVAFMFDWEGGESASGSTSRPIGFRAGTGSGGSEVCLLNYNQATNPAAVALMLNGSAGTASSTFTITKNTRYYVWLDFNASGTSSLHISTTTTKPTVGTDTSTSFATSGTSGSTQPDRFTLIGTRNNGRATIDGVYWSASSAIGSNPWGF